MTTADVEVAGVTIPKGSLVNLRYGSANRDARKYECPEVFHVARANASSHLAFGTGIHHCIGAQLARREIAIERKSAVWGTTVSVAVYLGGRRSIKQTKLSTE